MDYKTPEEVSSGRTPDISKFRFHFYEPLWYFNPKLKTPKDNLLKARFLAIAESCGDAMTYYILTEPENKHTKRQVLMRSVVKTRRKNIGLHTEYVNDTPEMESFTLSLEEVNSNLEQITSTPEVPLLLPGEKIAEASIQTEGGTVKHSDKEDEELEDDETLPPLVNASNNAESYQDIAETTNPNIEGDLSFRKILEHTWINGVLFMKVQYTDTVQGTMEIDTPFAKLKKDEPIPCAKYIKEYIAESRRSDRPLNDWATRTIQEHARITRRMNCINHHWRSKHETPNTRMIRRMLQHRLDRKLLEHRIRRNGPSRNQRLLERKNKEKFGIKIPNTTAEALQFDREAGNTKWKDAIDKEMGNLDRLKVFKYYPSNKEFDKEEGWQKAPLRMIFDIKNEDRRYKARLVVGGHKVDSSDYNTYSSQVDTLSVHLLFLISQHMKLDLMTADVGNAFPTAPNQEKVWCVAGDEFGDRKGAMIEIQRAMYGLSGSSRAFADFLGDCLHSIGFEPSRADPDLWIKKMEHGYDYIATHVDDLIVVAKKPQEYLALIEQEFALRNIESEPSYYLGTSLKRLEDGRIHMNSEDYIKESIRKYEANYNITLKKENIPMPCDAHPELDNTEPLIVIQHKEYQHIIGLGQWITLTGRIDIAYPVSSLARFAANPREGHLKLA